MATTMVFTLVSCGGDEDKVKKYAQELDKEIQGEMGDLTAMGMSVAVESRGTKLVVAISMDDAILDMVPTSEFSGLAEGFESVCPIETVQKDCPEVSAIVIELRKTSGDVVYSEEIK